MKTFYLSVPEETRDYLQRLDHEVAARAFIIDRMMTAHKDDTDASVFNSVPFKTYMKQFEEKSAEYDIAKKKFTKYLAPLVQKQEGVENVEFNWLVEDFRELRVKITVN